MYFFGCAVSFATRGLPTHYGYTPHYTYTLCRYLMNTHTVRGSHTVLHTVPHNRWTSTLFTVPVLSSPVQNLLHRGLLRLFFTPMVTGFYAFPHMCLLLSLHTQFTFIKFTYTVTFAVVWRFTLYSYTHTCRILHVILFAMRLYLDDFVVAPRYGLVTHGSLGSLRVSEHAVVG